MLKYCHHTWLLYRHLYATPSPTANPRERETVSHKCHVSGIMIQSPFNDCLTYHNSLESPGNVCVCARVSAFIPLYFWVEPWCWISTFEAFLVLCWFSVWFHVSENVVCRISILYIDCFMAQDIVSSGMCSMGTGKEYVFCYWWLQCPTHVH